MAHKVGHDYGIKPFLMVVSDFRFIELFSKAEWLGLMYIFGQDGEKIVPVQIGFLFRKEEPAAEFMEMIVSWSKETQKGRDVINIDFIEKKDNKYVIALSPDIQSLSDRLLPTYLEGKVTEITVSPSHFKELDISENFKIFKENYVNGTPLPIGHFVGSPDLMNKVPRKGKGFFMQNNINFYHEDDDTNQIVSNYKNVSKAKPRNKNPRKPSVKERAKIESAANARRISEIQLYYPVTYNRIVKRDWLNEIRTQLQKKYSIDLIIQAICNLILLERLHKEGKLTKEFIENGAANNILEYLCNNYESFKSYYPDDLFFTKYKIESQINRDRKELSNFLSK